MERKVVKRTGMVVDFDIERIRRAITLAVKASGKEVDSDAIDALVETISEDIDSRFSEFYPNVENIQDVVEKHLVKAGLYEVAKEYILYRAERQKERELKKAVAVEQAEHGKLTVTENDGKVVSFNPKKLEESLKNVCSDLPAVNVSSIEKEIMRNIYDGITTVDLEQLIIMTFVSFLERDPDYDTAATRFLLRKIYREVFQVPVPSADLYEKHFEQVITSLGKDFLDERMISFDLSSMAKKIAPERDFLFTYIGIQTLYERYLLKKDGKCIETPQMFWMRVAMGTSLLEKEKETHAISFYEIMSEFKYVPSSPTLFHSGTKHPQLSSCYLTTVADDLRHIFKCYGDNAQLSKWAGGVANDWSYIRSTGAKIKSANIKSQGVIPFLKIQNEVTNAINRSGRRRGAVVAYLETWHLDFEDFLDLRKNTGDERRRTHDMNTANWIPDLFMKRVKADAEWTLFSPNDVPDLHDLYGKKFEEAYEAYEKKARNGEITSFKVLSAKKLWRKMLSMLFETGHPWITFKDPSNIRSPQDHAGVVHSSNLCTEITLNTSSEETAVCNLGSVNLVRHISNGALDSEAIAKTVKTAVRMLDNVIDINFYPTKEAQTSNFRHRPIGLGLMGFQDALFVLDHSFESDEALRFADTSMELISYNAILASSELAKERGAYESYKGSKWDRNIFPVDTIELVEKERGISTGISANTHLDWTSVREHVKQHGMRNSNVMAIAPTASISTLVTTFPCIEPIYKNIYVKSNISGEFTVVNTYLVRDLKKLNLWNQDMLDQLKYYDGNIENISAIPDELKKKYKEAFDINPFRAIDITAHRGKWLDQSQSHNVFIKGTSGKLLNNTYMYAWEKGLKTTYYLRTLGATQIEKSTLDAQKFGFTQKREYKAASVPATQVGKVCSIMDPECEACQ